MRNNNVQHQSSKNNYTMNETIFIINTKKVVHGLSYFLDSPYYFMSY